MALNFEYQITYSKRKTLCIKITRDECVKVIAPKGMKKKDIESFIFKKSDWIEKTLLRVHENNDFINKWDFENCTLPFYGREFPLVRAKGERAGFDGESFYIPQNAKKEDIPKLLREIYRNLSKNYLVKRTRELCEFYGEKINDVKINKAKTRWGSCSSKRNINLSLYLIAASPEAVDYCIIHEICHLKQMNHSKAFWDLVEKRDPDYKIHSQELKELGRSSALQNF